MPTADTKLVPEVRQGMDGDVKTSEMRVGLGGADFSFGSCRARSRRAGGGNSKRCPLGHCQEIDRGGVKRREIHS